MQASDSEPLLSFCFFGVQTLCLLMFLLVFWLFRYDIEPHTLSLSPLAVAALSLHTQSVRFVATCKKCQRRERFHENLRTGQFYHFRKEAIEVIFSISHISHTDVRRGLILMPVSKLINHTPTSFMLGFALLGNFAEKHIIHKKLLDTMPRRRVCVCVCVCWQCKAISETSFINSWNITRGGLAPKTDPKER